MEVGILRDDRESVFCSVAPDDVVIGGRETDLADVCAALMEIDEVDKEAGRKVLVEQ